MKKCQNISSTRRNSACQSIVRYLGMYAVLLIFMALLELTIFTGCSSCSEDGKYDFKTSRDALDKYHEYLADLRGIKHTNTKDFGSLLCQWREVSDTVYLFLLKDSVIYRHHNEADDYFLIHDSVRKEMLRLTETWKYSYSDVIAIKDKTCAYKDDAELLDVVHEAEPFFNAMDSVAISVCDKSSILKRYRYFLKETLKTGINSKAELLEFLSHEDFLFRTFLAHLYEMDNEPLADITRNTEQICTNIFEAAQNGKIPSRDAVVYMSMRTVRRLLQNSAECVDNISRLDMKDEAQGNAYLWMIIQPFISIDRLSFATMTSQDRKRFDYIAEQLPKSRRFADTFDIDLKALNYLLPQQLLKIYVLSL